MTTDLHTFIFHVSLLISGKVKNVLEIGSLVAPQQDNLGNLSQFFPGAKYTGIDMCEGPNVDIIMNAEDLTGIKDKSFDLILCLETLEHAQHPQRIAGEVFRKLKDNGLVIYSSPMHAPVHYENDYWRMTLQCMKEVILYGYGEKKVYFQGPKNYPHNIIGIGSKTKIPFKIDLCELNSMLPWPYPFNYEEL